jgi:O-antigen/teichoic acid export membrane protein
MIGTGIAQGLPLMISPFLTRLYSEHDFALFTTFSSIASILIVGVGGRYQFAIVLPLKESESAKLFSLSIYITIVYSFLLLLGCVIIDLTIQHPLDLAIYLLPIYVCFYGLWTCISFVSIRDKTFLHNATAKIVQSVVYIFTSVGFGFLKFTLLGLIIGRVLGVFLSGLYLQRVTFKFSYFVNVKNLKDVSRKYIDYPKYGLVPAFLDIASVQGIILIMTWFYSTGDVGFLGLTTLVLSAPISLIGGSFKDVFYQKMVSLINIGSYHQARNLFIKSAFGLFSLGVPICLVIYFFGPEAFTFVFGEKWERSGQFASLICLSFLLQLVVSPLSSIFNAANKLKIASYWQTLYFLTTFVSLGISSFILRLTVDDLLVVYVVHELVLYSIYFFLQYWTLKQLT